MHQTVTIFLCNRHLEILTSWIKTPILKREPYETEISLPILHHKILLHLSEMQTWHTDRGCLAVIVECCTFLSKGSSSHQYNLIKPLLPHWDSDHLHIKNRQLIKGQKLYNTTIFQFLNHKQIKVRDRILYAKK